jgi:hypothetical protein
MYCIHAQDWSEFHNSCSCKIYTAFPYVLCSVLFTFPMHKSTIIMKWAVYPRRDTNQGTSSYGGLNILYQDHNLKLLISLDVRAVDLVQGYPMLNVVYQFSTCNLVHSNLPRGESCILITAFRENGMKLFAEMSLCSWCLCLWRSSLSVCSCDFLSLSLWPSITA